MIPQFPDFAEISLDIRDILHPRFQSLPDGISEFTFANIYLFRNVHHYRVSCLPDDLFIIIGRDDQSPFFMLPFGLPDESTIKHLFSQYKTIKAVSQSQAEPLTQLGCSVREDRDNFDYLYAREDLVNLTGRKFHRKKNLLNMFVSNYQYQGRPLLEEYAPDALHILDEWKSQRPDPGDYESAKEAIRLMEPLQLCGGIFYVDDYPVAYSLGEELAQGRSFVIHFEKAVRLADYKGVYQFVNQAFASILPEKYRTVNREQDLGDPGLQHAKQSYNPLDFVKKFQATL